MYDQVEAAVGKRAKISHVAFDSRKDQALPFGNAAVLRQLARRVVKPSRARRPLRQPRPVPALLPAPGGKTQDISPPQFGKPVPRHHLFRRQRDLPLPAARRGYGPGIYGNGPYTLRSTARSQARRL